MAYRLVYQGVTPEYYSYGGQSGTIAVAYYEDIPSAYDLANALIEKHYDEGVTPLSVRIWQDGRQWKSETVAYGSFISLPVIEKILLWVVGALLATLVIWAIKNVLGELTEFIHGYEPVINPETGEVEWEPPESPWVGVVKWAAIGGIGIAGIYLLSKSDILTKKKESRG